MCVCVYVRACVRVRACMCACVRVCVCVCAYKYNSMYIYIYIYILCVHGGVPIIVFMHACKCAYIAGGVCYCLYLRKLFIATASEFSYIILVELIDLRRIHIQQAASFVISSNFSSKPLWCLKSVCMSACVHVHTCPYVNILHVYVLFV